MIPRQCQYLSVLSGFMSVFFIVLGYEDFTCSRECLPVKLPGYDEIMVDMDSNATLEQRKSTTTDFLHTAPCPPIWNFTLVCNYFSRDKISCDESTTILTRCLNYYDSYIPCNTTLHVIERCMAENVTVCESLFALYSNYCFNTCRESCNNTHNFTQMYTKARRTLISDITEDYNTKHIANTSLLNTIAAYFPNDVNPDSNGSHIKVIHVKESRTDGTLPCDALCVILLISGAFFLIGILGIIGCCTVKRYRMDDSSYKVHSQDKCVGPDERGMGADSALLPVIGFKERGPDIPRRYRNAAIIDTSFAQVHHYPHCTHKLLGRPVHLEEIDDTRF